MKWTIDTTTQTLTTEDEEIPLYSKEAFSLLSELWLKAGWNLRYHYTFSWLGRPVLQLPEDLLRMQEVLWELKPDLVIETGIALGGSLLFYASLCQLNGKGSVVGIDIDLRPQNRTAIENHPLFPWITLLDGDSLAPATHEKLASLTKGKKSVLVVLDANHSYHHVRQELEQFAPLVTPGSYLVVADGFKKSLADVPRGKTRWEWDNPLNAIEDFLADHPEFTLQYPERRYNRSPVRLPVTHFPSGWLLKQ
ncbi:MAG: Rhamnosyl O-methyltransferase [Chlamydiae bacterium]|nr:Rhamnosyl O-methyltransferase [Chlamydiota bacterium]